MVIFDELLSEKIIIQENGYATLTEQKIDTPQKLSGWMKRNIKYKSTGKLLSIDEIMNNKYGDCHDQSLFAYKYLRKLKYKCGRLFMVEYYSWNAPGGKTHTLVWYIDKNKYYWFENAWGTKAGIHGPYKNINELKDDVANNWEYSGKNDKLYMASVGSVYPGMSLEEYVISCTPEKAPNVTYQKSTQVTESISSNGDNGITIRLSPRKSFMDQYDEIHKVLQEDNKNHNVNGMKHNLGLMFSLITMIERSKKYKNRDKEAVKARAFAINDFKTYLKIVQKEDKNFDFMSFYEENHYGKTILNIDIETIKVLKQLFKSIIL